MIEIVKQKRFVINRNTWAVDVVEAVRETPSGLVLEEKSDSGRPRFIPRSVKGKNRVFETLAEAEAELMSAIDDEIRELVAKAEGLRIIYQDLKQGRE